MPSYLTRSCWSLLKLLRAFKLLSDPTKNCSYRYSFQIIQIAEGDFLIQENLSQNFSEISVFWVIINLWKTHPIFFRNCNFWVHIYMKFGHDSVSDIWIIFQKSVLFMPELLWGSHCEFLRLNKITWVRCNIMWVTNSPNKQSACSPISCQNNKLIMNLK